MKKQPTALGVMLRQLRVANNQTQGDIADKLGMQASYWSAIEVGKKPFPESQIETLAGIFNLDDSKKEQLKSLAENFKTAYTINVVGYDDDKRILAAAFARRLSELPAEKVKTMKEILGV